MTSAAWILLTAIGVVGTIGAITTGWLVGVLVNARRRRDNQGLASAATPRLAVVVPAHNEEMVLAETLRSIAAQEYPTDQFRTVVVADNCTDSTARIAREAGVLVLERTDLVARGKGFALAWALERVLSRQAPVAGFVPDACVFIDADTWVAPTCLAALAARMPQDPSVPVAVQGRYGVLNTESGWRSALMTAAFELCNHVRLAGIDRMGGSVGLKGNGMIFSRGVLERVPWTGSSVTEDIDYGLDLLLEGIRVAYCPEAVVKAQMPVTAAQGESQRARWEGGRYRLMRRRVPTLLKASLGRRDPRLAMAALDLMALPLAELVTLQGFWMALCAIGAWQWPGMVMVVSAALCAANAAGIVFYVLLGLRTAGAGPEAYRALWRVPIYVGWKLALYVRGRLGRKRGAAKVPPGADMEWVRTERIATSTAAATGNEEHLP